ncbi:uroplakin-2-like [Pristis pectinata]|uniref:uroplakin-2-like n=1 Tax=Pristis pectinata TaxID=685728 RepID=UPI00223D2DD6|nr:uroplakin-2-like [Pristis pectinata]
MAHTVRLLILLALASITGAADFNISLVDETASGIVASIRSTSAFITLPPCNLAGTTVMVNVTNMAGSPGISQSSFAMPFCRFKRGLISLMSNADGFSQTLNVGYQVKGLTANTKYNVSYHVGSQVSNLLEIKTTTAMNYQNIDTGFGRSGAMVVITVLLVVAMAVLIVCFIVAVVLGK